jgi:hypothetical protein
LIGYFALLSPVIKQRFYKTSRVSFVVAGGAGRVSKDFRDGCDNLLLLCPLTSFLAGGKRQEQVKNKQTV